MNQWTVTPDYIDHEAGRCFASLTAAFALEGEAITRDKISQVVRVVVGSQRYYVKRYVGRGFHPRRLLAPPRAVVEWTNLMRFARWNIPTAALVAYGQARRFGVFLRGALITAEIPDTIDLERFALEAPAALRDRSRLRTLSRRVAHIVRTLHQHRFTHNDLHWRNLLYRPATQEVFLIDCPSGAFWSGPLLEYRIVKDLASLDKVARKHLSATQRLRFLLDYTGTTRLRATDKRLIRKVLAAYHHRRRRKGQPA